MNRTKECFFLCYVINRLLKRIYSRTFKNLILWNNNQKKILAKQFYKKLTNNRGQMLRCVIWMIKTGKINLSHRALLRWKVQVFQNSKDRIAMFLTKDKYSSLRSFWNINQLISSKKKQIFFISWKETSSKLSKIISKSQNKKGIRARYFIFLMKKILFCYFEFFKKRLCKKPYKELRFRFFLLNLILKKNLKRHFNKMKQQEYWYIEEYEEVYTESNKVIKDFSLYRKPFVAIEYHNEISFNPTFRAIWRNLNHLVNKKMKIELNIWRNYIDKFNDHMECVTSFLSDSSDLSTFKLSKDKQSKLKIFLIHILYIQRKIYEMPKAFLIYWSSKAHVNILKVLKFKILILKSQFQFYQKKICFESFKEKLRYSNNFLDIN